jgi:tyrosine-protein kinase
VQPANVSLLGFRDYLAVLTRRRNTVLFAVFVVAALAVGSALLQTPRYVATASVLIKQSDAADVLDPGAAAAVANPTMQLQTEIDVITSQPVRQAVEAKLGSSPTVSASAHGGADIIDISARSTDARSAATIANTYANAFVQYSSAQDLDAALAAEAQIQARITDLQTQIDGLNAQITGASAANQAQVNATLGPQVDDLTQQLGTFKQQLSQIQVQAAVSSGEAQLVSGATTPRSPVSPKPVRDLILAIVAGLMLGVGAAYALEYFDDSVKSSDELARALVGTPNVGLIPVVPGWKDRRQPLLVTLSDPASPSAEAYRALRTTLQFDSLERPLRTVLVTSPSAGDGKTTVLSNLGLTLAQVGQRVIIACCDLRRPRLHEFFGLTNTVGFTSVVLGEQPVFTVLQQVPGVPDLRILASGPLPANPAEMLSSARAGEVLAALQGDADIVLIDSPPILPVTDAAVLTRLVDGTLLVVTEGATTRKQVSQALAILGQVDAVVLGTVLNEVSADDSYRYAYQPYAADRRAVAPSRPDNGSGAAVPPRPPSPPGSTARTSPGGRTSQDS